MTLSRLVFTRIDLDAFERAQQKRSYGAVRNDGYVAFRRTRDNLLNRLKDPLLSGPGGFPSPRAHIRLRIEQRGVVKVFVAGQDARR